MAIITVPTIPATSLQMQLVRGDSTLETFSGAEVVVQSNKALWSISFPLKPLKEAAAAKWRAALVQLSKLSNTFKVTPPNWVGPGTGYSGAQPLVKGGSQLGLSLVCDIVNAPSVAIALAGDYLEVNGEFKCLVQDATTAAGGSPNEVTFVFEPALRDPPSDNALVDILTPQLEVRLNSPVAIWSGALGDFHQINIEAIESFGL